jgi:hypothetical protein
MVGTRSNQHLSSPSYSMQCSEKGESLSGFSSKGGSSSESTFVGSDMHPENIEEASNNITKVEVSLLIGWRHWYFEHKIIGFKYPS